MRQWSRRRRAVPEWLSCSSRPQCIEVRLQAGKPLVRVRGPSASLLDISPATRLGLSCGSDLSHDGVTAVLEVAVSALEPHDLLVVPHCAASNDTLKHQPVEVVNLRGRRRAVGQGGDAGTAPVDLGHDLLGGSRQVAWWRRDRRGRLGLSERPESHVKAGAITDGLSLLAAEPTLLAAAPQRRRLQQRHVRALGRRLPLPTDKRQSTTRPD